VVGRLSLLPLAEDARVTLLHAVPASLPPRERRQAEHDASRALITEAQHLRNSLSRNVSITPIVKIGAAADAIRTIASRVRADLILMGRRSGRVWHGTFLGSTAERVIRQARLPVLVVRLPPRRVYARPALALDFDRVAYDVVRLLLVLLAAPRPEVTVLHGFDEPYHGLIYSGLSELAEERKVELRLEVTRKLKNLLSDAVKKAKVTPRDAPSWKLYVQYGSPRHIVGRTVTKTEPDLLALGTRAHTGAAHLFFGTVAGDLLRQANCDVLLVPPTPPRG
jgi:nucleotide-binding universal stress UspA family protein